MWGASERRERPTSASTRGRTGRRLDGGAGGGWQEQGFGVTASLTRSRGERPWEATGTTSIARIDKESSTTTGTLIIIIIIGRPSDREAAAAAAAPTTTHAIARSHRRHADRLREPDSTTLWYLQIGPEVEKIR